MIFTYYTLDRAEQRVERATAQLQAALRRYGKTDAHRAWLRVFVRMTQARALVASNRVDGVRVSNEDALAAIDGEDPANTDRDAWRAAVGCRQATDYLLQRCKDPFFAITEDVLLAVHFMICQSNPSAHPGQYRPGWISVHHPGTDDVAREGVDRDRLEPLLRELLDYANRARSGSAWIRAAMTHLNLALLHPFTGGNGRTARCIHAAMLGEHGNAAVILDSIDEYIGRHHQEYDDILATLGDGGWHPQRRAKPWIRFCLRGHYWQAQTLLRRAQEMERTHAALAEQVAAHDLPHRAALALLQAAFGERLRNASYRISANVSKNLASRDLKALTDAGLLVPEGDKRGRSYSASAAVTEIREVLRLPRKYDNPFARNKPARPPASQRDLFA